MEIAIKALCLCMHIAYGLKINTISTWTINWFARCTYDKHTHTSCVVLWCMFCLYSSIWCLFFLLFFSLDAAFLTSKFSYEFAFSVQDAWQCDICGSKSGRGFGKSSRVFHCWMICLWCFSIFPWHWDPCMPFVAYLRG